MVWSAFVRARERLVELGKEDVGVKGAAIRNY